MLPVHRTGFQKSYFPKSHIYCSCLTRCNISFVANEFEMSFTEAQAYTYVSFAELINFLFSGFNNNVQRRSLILHFTCRRKLWQLLIFAVCLKCELQHSLISRPTQVRYLQVKPYLGPTHLLGKTPNFNSRAKTESQLRCYQLLSSLVSLVAAPTCPLSHGNIQFWWSCSRLLFTVIQSTDEC